MYFCSCFRFFSYVQTPEIVVFNTQCEKTGRRHSRKMGKLSYFDAAVVCRDVRQTNSPGEIPCAMEGEGERES